MNTGTVPSSSTPVARAMTCPCCHYENPAGATLCERCGADLALACADRLTGFSEPPGSGEDTPALFATRHASGFVGRARELALLRARLDDTVAGAGSLAMLVGEPGIGKTRTAEQIAAEARRRGAVVLWGRCYEGDWAPPFGPWIEAIADYARVADHDRLQGELGPGAPTIAQLVPAIRALFPDLPTPVPLGADEERFRLHDAITQFLIAVAETRPVALVLDDLHWADPASLGLLRHLAHFVQRARLLVVGTYRDVDLDRGHPLTDLLGALHRGSHYGHLPLRGLTQAEVGDLLTHAARQDVADDLAATIHAETDGNPFFVEEVISHLLEEGALVSHDGRLTADRPLAGLGIPEGVRQVVGRRLARLSPATNQLLGYAAVFTGGFDFRVLQALTELPEEMLLGAIDEALAARVIQAVDPRLERYDFVHALVRHALAETWSPSRRVRLHRRAAEALAQVHAAREAEHAAELAVQYHESAALPGAAKGILYALTAAERAKATGGREQAVTFLRMARDLALEVDAGSRGSILSKLALAEAEALLLDVAPRTVEQALAALEESEAEPATIAGFLTAAARALKEGAADVNAWRPLVERGLALAGERHDLIWARLMLLRDPIATIDGATVRAGRWVGFDPEAVAIARASGEEDDYARTLESFDARTRQETRDVVALAQRWQRPMAIMRAMTVAANDWQYRHGDFREASALWRELRAMSERYGAIFWQAASLYQLTYLEIAAGDFARAQEDGAHANELMARQGPYRESDVLAMETAFCFAYALDGDWPAIAAFWTRFVMAPAASAQDISLLAGLLYAAMAAVAHARAGNDAEARRLLDALTPVLIDFDLKTGNQNQNGAVAFAGDAIWDLGAANLAAPYRDLAHRLIAAGIGDYPQTSLDLTLARMSALLGDLDATSRHFAGARAALERSGQRPLRAIVDYDEALALTRSKLVSGEAARIRALLDAAQTEFRALGMERWVERTLTAIDDLAARTAGGRTVLPAGLTEREVDVLRLIARGYSDRQISDELFISQRTVNAHVRNMLGKTDLGNRTELSVWAVEHGLVSRDAEPQDR